MTPIIWRAAAASYRPLQSSRKLNLFSINLTRLMMLARQWVLIRGFTIVVAVFRQSPYVTCTVAFIKDGKQGGKFLQRRGKWVTVADSSKESSACSEYLWLNLTSPFPILLLLDNVHVTLYLIPAVCVVFLGDGPCALSWRSYSHSLSTIRFSH